MTTIHYAHTLRTRWYQHFAGSIAALALLSASACIVLDDVDDVDDDDDMDDTSDADVAVVRAQQAKDEFWRVFSASSYELAPVVSAQLDAASANLPDDPELVLLAAHSKFWQVVESQRDQLGTSPQTFQMLSQAAGMQLGQYMQMRPDDKRPFSWIAPLQFAGAAATGDMAGLQAAMDLADVGIAQAPGFNNFARLVMEAQLPATHPLYARALDGAYGLLEARFDRTISRDDATSIDMHGLVAAGKCQSDSYPSRPAAAHGAYANPDPTCWNSWLAPHEYEGLWLFLGDTWLKGSHLSAARQAYENATLLPSYVTWPYKDLVHDRLTNFDELSDRLSDATVDNDPVLINQSEATCSVCHAR